MVRQLALQLEQESARMCAWDRKGQKEWDLPTAAITAAMADAVRNRRVIEFLWCHQFVRWADGLGQVHNLPLINTYNNKNKKNEKNK